MRERVSQLYALLVKKVHLQFTSDLRIQDVNFAKHFGQFVRACTCDLLRKFRLFFKSSHSVKAVFEFMHFAAW